MDEASQKNLHTFTAVFKGAWAEFPQFLSPQNVSFPPTRTFYT